MVLHQSKYSYLINLMYNRHTNEQKTKNKKQKTKNKKQKTKNKKTKNNTNNN